MIEINFAIADTHFGHNNIIKYCHRPFLNKVDQRELDFLGGRWHSGSYKSNPWKISRESVEIMDNTLIDNINAVVGENDVLWHLGDFTMFKDHEPIKDYKQRVKRYRDRIKCRNVHLILGNHDSVECSEYFTSVHRDHEFYIKGFSGLFTLNHYIKLTFNKSHRLGIGLYGHSHASAEEWMDQHCPNRRSLDVGVDNAFRLFGEYRPFRFTEIVNMFKNRSGFSMDHHIDPNNLPPEESSLEN